MRAPQDGDGRGGRGKTPLWGELPGVPQGGNLGIGELLGSLQAFGDGERRGGGGAAIGLGIQKDVGVPRWDLRCAALGLGLQGDVGC